MRIMAIDYGDARTGVAVSDITGTLAGDAWVIKGRRAEIVADAIADAARDRGVERIVLGYPLNMDGTAGLRAEKSLELRDMLAERTGLDIVMWDERRTTVAAHNILSENGRRGKKRKDSVDAVAATLILEGYLNSLK